MTLPIWAEGNMGAWPLIDTQAPGLMKIYLYQPTTQTEHIPHLIKNLVRTHTHIQTSK